MNAENRAWELMRTPTKNLPSLADKYVKHLCQEIGICIDVYFIGYLYYAQAIEHLKPADKIHQIDKAGRKWFKENS